MATPYGFTVEIAIEDLAAFMPINNSFCKTAGENWPKHSPYWNGVLIQLGEYETHGDQQQIKKEDRTHFEGKRMDVFHRDEAVVFYRQDGSPATQLTLSLDELKTQCYWINVIPTKPKNINDGENEERPRDLPLTVGDIGDLGIVNPIRPVCRHFKPFGGGITFWYDVGEGYDLETRMDVHSYKPEVPKPLGSHDRYTFSLTGIKNSYRVEIYRNGEEWVKLKEPIVKIRVQSNDKIKHGEGHGKHKDGGI